jgi:hypothetical protein
MSDLFGLGRRLPCLSYWQPWASLHIAGLKILETRHWPTRVRGLVAIHASKKVDRAGAPDSLCEYAFGPEWWTRVERGAVIGVATLTGCHRTEDLLAEGLRNADHRSGNFDPGRFGFRMEEVRPLLEPLPLIGRQGWFEWQAPPDLEDRLGPPVDQDAASSAWEAHLAA